MEILAMPAIGMVVIGFILMVIAFVVKGGVCSGHSWWRWGVRTLILGAAVYILNAAAMFFRP